MTVHVLLHACSENGFVGATGGQKTRDFSSPPESFSLSDSSVISRPIGIPNYCMYRVHNISRSVFQN